MQTKLTLRLDEKLIQSAKRYSKRRGKSLSQITAEYFALLTIQKTMEEADVAVEQLPPITRFLKGLLRESNISVDDYRQYLEDKYL